MKNKITDFKNKITTSGVVSRKDIQNFELYAGKNIVSQNINLNKFTTHPSSLYLNELKVCLESELGKLSPLESLPNYSFFYYNYSQLNKSIITIKKLIDSMNPVVKDSIIASNVADMPIVESFRHEKEFYERLFKDNLNLNNAIDSGLEKLSQLLDNPDSENECFLTFFDYLQNVRGEHLLLEELNKLVNRQFINYLLNIKPGMVSLTWNRLFNYNYIDLLSICSYLSIRLQKEATFQKRINYDPLPILDIKALDCYEPSTLPHDEKAEDMSNIHYARMLSTVTDNLINFSNSKDINVVIDVLSMINLLTGVL